MHPTERMHFQSSFGCHDHRPKVWPEIDVTGMGTLGKLRGKDSARRRAFSLPASWNEAVMSGSPAAILPIPKDESHAGECELDR